MAFNFLCEKKSLPIHAIDGETRFAESSGTTDPVQIGLKIYSSFQIDQQIVIHHHGDVFNISASNH